MTFGLDMSASEGNWNTPLASAVDAQMTEWGVPQTGMDKFLLGGLEEDYDGHW